MVRAGRVLAVALALLATACAPNHGSERAATAKTTLESTSDGLVVERSPDGKSVTVREGSGRPATPSAGKAGAHKLTPEEEAYLATVPADFIRSHAKIKSEDEPVLVGCSMRRGETCSTRIDGVYRLSSLPVASIVIGAYDDDAAEPSWSFTLPNARSPGSSFFADPFVFRVSPTAKRLTFRSRLVAPDGRVLAVSTDDRSFTIP